MSTCYMSSFFTLKTIIDFVIDLKCDNIFKDFKRITFQGLIFSIPQLNVRMQLFHKFHAIWRTVLIIRLDAC